MKTILENNRNMKTRISQLVVVAFFAFTGLGNVSAKETRANVSSLENEKEPQLQVEDWMINANYWNESETAFYAEQVAEGSLELESWMTDENTWKVNNPVVQENETEKVLTLESWMVDENIWN